MKKKVAIPEWYNTLTSGGSSFYWLDDGGSIQSESINYLSTILLLKTIQENEENIYGDEQEHSWGGLLPEYQFNLLKQLAMNLVYDFVDPQTNKTIEDYLISRLNGISKRLPEHSEIIWVHKDITIFDDCTIQTGMCRCPSCTEEGFENPYGDNPKALIRILENHKIDFDKLFDAVCTPSEDEG